jgi:mannose-6-phosphate isomerase-like protein (cupin superfamily)
VTPPLHEGDARIVVVANISVRHVDKPHAYYDVLHESSQHFRIVLKQTIRPGHSSVLHIHPGAELYIVLLGTLRIETDAGMVDVPRDHTAFVPTRVPHRVVNTSDHEEVVCILLLGPEYSNDAVVPYQPSRPPERLLP